jgi:hypothetical protein
MLERMRPGLLDEWIAFEAVEPSGQQWLQTAIIANEVASLAALVQVLMGSKSVQWPKLQNFMPGRKAEKPEKPKETAAEALQKRAEREQAMLRQALQI